MSINVYRKILALIFIASNELPFRGHEEIGDIGSYLKEKDAIRQQGLFRNILKLLYESGDKDVQVIRIKKLIRKFLVIG